MEQRNRFSKKKIKEEKTPREIRFEKEKDMSTQCNAKENVEILLNGKTAILTMFWQLVSDSRDLPYLNGGFTEKVSNKINKNAM